MMLYDISLVEHGSGHQYYLQSFVSMVVAADGHCHASPSF
jgi:hypothetical protein